MKHNSIVELVLVFSGSIFSVLTTQEYLPISPLNHFESYDKRWLKESPLLLLCGVTCKVYSSPPMYSLDQVFDGFQARSQMLMGHLEEQDEVVHCQFSDNSEDEESEGQDKSRIRYVAWKPFSNHYYHC